MTSEEFVKKHVRLILEEDEDDTKVRVTRKSKLLRDVEGLARTDPEQLLRALSVDREKLGIVETMSSSEKFKRIVTAARSSPTFGTFFMEPEVKDGRLRIEVVGWIPKDKRDIYWPLGAQYARYIRQLLLACISTDIIEADADKLKVELFQRYAGTKDEARYVSAKLIT